MTTQFDFRFDPKYRAAAAAFGITPANSRVEVSDDHLDARLGRWRVRTPLSNVVGVERSGPYSIPKTIGPARLSVADRGLTFATNPDAGLCIRFAEPVTGIAEMISVRNRTLTDLDELGLAQLFWCWDARGDLVLGHSAYHPDTDMHPAEKE